MIQIIFKIYRKRFGNSESFFIFVQNLKLNVMEKEYSQVVIEKYNRLKETIKKISIINMNKVEPELEANNLENLTDHTKNDDNANAALKLNIIKSKLIEIGSNSTSHGILNICRTDCCKWEFVLLEIMKERRVL